MGYISPPVAIIHFSSPAGVTHHLGLVDKMHLSSATIETITIFVLIYLTAELVVSPGNDQPQLPNSKRPLAVCSNQNHLWWSFACGKQLVVVSPGNDHRSFPC
jgi:hypothetical protein